MRRKTSRVVSLGVSLIVAVAAALVGSGSAAAGQDSDPPDIPANLRITELSANNVTLAWDPPDGAVRYRVSARTGTVAASQSASVDEPTVTLHLHQGRSYVVDVVAYDADGQWSARMDPEDRLTFRTPVDPDDPPVTTPTIVRAEVDPGTLGIVVEWEASTSEAGGVSYRAGIREVGSHGTRTVDTDELTTTFYVPPGKTYRVSVTATDNARRTAGASTEVTAPFVPAPSPPENVNVTSSPGSVTVGWDAPTDGAPVKQYGVTLHNAPGGTRVQSTTDTTAKLDLPPGGELEVTVSAGDWLNRRSDPSDPVQFTMAPADDWAPPSAPGNFRATPTDSGVLFQWDEPVEGIGPFTYEIHLDGSEVEEVRGDLQLDSDYFFACNVRPWATPAEFTITAKSYGFVSPHSEPIKLCF